MSDRVTYNNTFSHDLIIGQNAENFLGKLLSERPIEVKLDKLAHKTGNVFVEYRSRGKPSGISTTEAEYWAFIIDGRGAIVLSTERLKEITKRTIKERGYIKGGDNKTSHGALVKVSELLA